VDSEPSEQVFFHGHPSWRSMPGFYLRGLVGAVLAGAIAGIATALGGGKVQTMWVVLIVLIAFVAGLVAGAARQRRTTYTITNRRLAIQRGLLSRDVRETRLEKVQNVNAQQTLLERLLGVGTVDFDTAGGAEFDFSFHGVEHPRRIVRTVDQALCELRRGGPDLSAPLGLREL
jgi:uncharacterized membrane protein YdbT with pleckstrin-like domain